MSSVEVLNVYNSKFLTFIFDMKLTAWSNSFYIYMYMLLQCIIIIFLDFGGGNNTNIDKAERGPLTIKQLLLCAVSCTKW